MKPKTTPPEIIAEIGQNHDGDMGRACELIHAAKAGGADVAKFQLFDAPRLFPRENNPWYDYNCKTELIFEQAERLKRECDDAGIEFMASAFDPERVGWLETLGVRRHKIASRSINDEVLIKAVAETDKPFLVSLGAWTEPGFPQFPEGGEVFFLYCVSEYPTPFERLRFGEIDFSVYAGFSDHTIGVEAAAIAMSRGAGILEKHFTLDKSSYGPDHAGSMTPDELAELSRIRDIIVKVI